MEYGHIETTYAGTINDTNVPNTDTVSTYQKSGGVAIVGGTGFEVLLKLETTTALLADDWIIIKMYDKITFSSNPTC